MTLTLLITGAVFPTETLAESLTLALLLSVAVIVQVTVSPGLTLEGVNVSVELVPSVVDPFFQT